ncbi:DUF1298 domain-containing protein [Haloechinothrix sp. YIM 98757]|uniref:diacylglycerol O-acyltransferase n=1 Tax=Haloechinothrix aidingensis TaxID=2752311 RepID=A0A838A7Q4_9PSEU|nr:wax ester/triacylglycerol synthase domain-containing protein [Haloechinothrix aidingensis]MBA0124401.1 DUF1298 domain-containing protein [Haloechinothrix aidingensis]
MSQQLGGLDVSFLCLEGSTRPMHLGAVLTFAPRCRVHPARIGRLLAERASEIPQLATTVRERWWPPGSREWVSDPHFEPDQHIHPHVLPRPGAPEQLESAVSAAMTQPLPMGRPPWQAHVFAGVADGRFAVLLKLHHALADAAGTWAVAGALLDDGTDRVPPPRTAAETTTAPPGSWARTVLGWPQRARRELGALAGTAGGCAGQAVRLGGITGATLSALRPGAVQSPITTLFGGTSHRRSSLIRLPVDHLQQARRRVGGTLNDVVLSSIAGGIGRWIRQTDAAAALARGWHPRAFVPVNMRHRHRGTGTGGNQLSGYLCDLPVRETDPVERLRSVRASMHANKVRGPGRGPGAFPLLAEALPTGAHRVTTPLLGQASALLFDTMISTIPVPRTTLRLDEAELDEIYPIAPLAPGQALAIAAAIHRDTVHLSLLSDPQVLPGVTGLGGQIAKEAASLHANGAQATEHNSQVHPMAITKMGSSGSTP